MRRQQRGFLLPATILLSLGVSIVAGTFLQFISNSSDALNARSYNMIAQEAARSGIEYANSCLTKDSQSEWTTLTPKTDCSGNNGGGSLYLYKQGTEWRSTFSVSKPDAQDNIVSTGTVEILNGSTVVKTYTSTDKMNIGGLYTTFPVSSGESITHIRNDSSDCAIANGKLYCWSPGGTPALVGGDIAGKTVTRVSVSLSNICVIADGAPYCWGSNTYGQLGTGNHSTRSQPTDNAPLVSSGPLSGHIVTDISTASKNNPAAIIWPFAGAYPHTCALTDDGAVSCWGDGGFRQNTGGGMGKACLIICIPTGFYTYPTYYSPHLTVGYTNTGQVLSGKKSIRVGASSHDTCALAEGKAICWGVKAPLPIHCWIPPLGQFSEANWHDGIAGTIIPFNPCIATFSNGYDTSTIGGSALAGKFIDPDSWALSANEACWMAHTDFVCFGTTPAFGLFWSDVALGKAWGAPWRMSSTWDVTNSDNGDNEAGAPLIGGVDGLYCIIDRGVAKCTGEPLNTYTGTGVTLHAYKSFYPLIETGGLSGLIPTKIAAGQTHGCLAANGQLFCWGAGFGTSIAKPYKPSAIGTAAGTYAANGPVSVGDNHSCGIANGQLFCWGDNSHGQLGMGDKYSVSQPQAVPALVNKYVTDVSAGKNHTCAIVYGKLYCWGDNSHGQLGNGTTTSTDEPDFAKPVAGALSGKRVTDISAGIDNTCAIANGQAYCWGNNSHKKLGDGSYTLHTSPVLVNGHGALTTSMSTTEISAGADHTCAVANADAYCWGWNQDGRTGLGINANTDSNPTLLTGGTAGWPKGPNNMRPSVSGISAGGDFSCGIFNATVSCWGKSDFGQTGTNTTLDRSVPTNISSAAGGYYATSVSAGDKHACAVINGNHSATNGNIWCWGAGANGRLGNGGVANSLVPLLINGGETIKGGVRRVATNISVGTSTTCSVANADILCWGAGTSGQLGNSFVIDSTTPTITSGFRFVTPYQRGPVF